MSQVIGLINYKTAGNIHSVHKALLAAGAEVILVDSPSQLNQINKLVLPGVGSYREAMQELDEQGFIKALKEWDKPILGICVGMQVLGSLGFEHGLTKGLSILDGEVKPMICNGKVPHVGFNSVELVKESVLFRGIEKSYFYFMHSYEMVNYLDIISLTEYAGHKFVSAVENGNVYGVQFHPEKSREAGIQLFKNFLTV